VFNPQTTFDGLGSKPLVGWDHDILQANWAKLSESTDWFVSKGYLPTHSLFDLLIVESMSLPDGVHFLFKSEVRH
jgi:hypothetical protein